jgi:ATP-dependent Clp protease ATP-binding subunit ClpC
MTDSLGRTIDFKNTIIIMTSNIGARQLQDFGTGVGFGTKTRNDNDQDNMKGVIQNALKKTFAPEFLNRIDDVLIFNSLTRKDILKIIDIELEKLFKRINTLGYNVELTKVAKEYIAEKGFDEKYGARPLNRAIQKYIEDPLAEEIIKKKVKEGDFIKLDFDKKTEEILVKIDVKKKKTKTKKD